MAITPLKILVLSNEHYYEETPLRKALKDSSSVAHIVVKRGIWPQDYIIKEHSINTIFIDPQKPTASSFDAVCKYIEQTRGKFRDVVFVICSTRDTLDRFFAEVGSKFQQFFRLDYESVNSSLSEELQDTLEKCEFDFKIKYREQFKNDIALSYASKDRDRVELLAKALKEQGWSVWWDVTIPPGKKFDQVIERAIATAKCVVVLWSKNSIKSDWVKEEATIAKHRNILVPAKIDPIEPPLGFGLIQAADLTEWKAETDHPGFTILLSAISEIAGPSPLKVKEAEKKNAEDERRRKQEQERKFQEEEQRKAEKEHKLKEAERVRKAEAKRKAKKEKLLKILKELDSVVRLHMESINAVVGKLRKDRNIKEAYQNLYDLVREKNFDKDYTDIRLRLRKFSNEEEKEEENLKCLQTLRDALYGFQVTVYMMSEDMPEKHWPSYNLEKAFRSAVDLYDILSDENTKKTDPDRVKKLKKQLRVFFDHWSWMQLQDGQQHELETSENVSNYIEQWFIGWHEHVQMTLHGSPNHKILGFNNALSKLKYTYDL